MTGYTAQDWAREFDKCLVRKVRRDGGTYEFHLANGAHEFFSERFYSKDVALTFNLTSKQYTFTSFVFDDFRVIDTTRNEVLNLYPNVHALKSMLKDRTFVSLNKWGTACQNALGANISSMSITRRLFADGQCYEDLIQAAKNAREASGEEVSESHYRASSESDYNASSEVSHPRWHSTGRLMPCTPSSEESDSA